MERRFLMIIGMNSHSVTILGVVDTTLAKAKGKQLSLRHSNKVNLMRS